MNFKIKKIWQKLKEKNFSPFYIFSVFLLRAGISLPFKFLYWRDLYLKFQPSSITLGLWRKSYSIEADAYLTETLVKENFVCFDIGANVGHLSLIMAKKANKGIVFAIEPSLKNFICLLNNIKLNNLSNIIPLNLAIQDKNDFVDFYDYVFADDQSSLAKSHNWKMNKYKVISLRLDNLLTLWNINKIDFLKVDVEGSELKVIKSLGRHISKVKYIWVEFIEDNFKNFGYSGKDILDYLWSHNFIIQKFNPANKSFMEIKNYTELENYVGNLLAVKQ